MRKCAWCGDMFPVKSLFSRDKYCDEHKKEAMKSKTLKRRINYYKRNKMKEQMRPGTGNEGPHPNLTNPQTYLGVNIPFTIFIREGEIIKNLLKSNNGVTVVYKGKYSYAKKTTKLTAIDKPVGQYGIQLTHNFATLNDYHKEGLNLILKQQTKKCPDCNQTETTKDQRHAEIQCSNCGLVLMGPYDLRIKYPFMEYTTSKDEEKEEKDDPMSWYPKPEKPIHQKNPNSIHTFSNDKTLVKVICSKCQRPDLIPYNEKYDGCPVCGGHYMGVGICMPHDFHDEFSPPKRENKIPYDLRTTEQRGIGE